MLGRPSSLWLQNKDLGDVLDNYHVYFGPCSLNVGTVSQGPTHTLLSCSNWLSSLTLLRDCDSTLNKRGGWEAVWFSAVEKQDSSPQMRGFSLVRMPHGCTTYCGYVLIALTYVPPTPPENMILRVKYAS